MAKRFRVLGSPISHSKSPQIHLAAYAALELDWQYDRSEVTGGNLAEFLKIDSSNGYSVTMPLKEEAYELANTRDEDAELAKAANTLIRTQQGFAAYNTDVFGIAKAIGSFSYSAYNLLGSGATARNALIALSKSAPGAKVRITARNQRTLGELVAFGTRLGLHAEACGEVRATDTELTISTIPGSADATGLIAEARGTLFDVAYSPWPSRLGAIWLANGGSLVSGFTMLVWQAIAQIRLFTTGNVAEPLPNELAIANQMLALADSE